MTDQVVRSRRRLRFLIVSSASLGFALGLFQLWPFTLAFLLLGGVGTFVISIIIGHAVNILLVFLIEFILMLLVLVLIVFYAKKHDHL